MRLGDRSPYVGLLMMVLTVVGVCPAHGQQRQPVGSWQFVGTEYYGAAALGRSVLVVGQYGSMLRSTDAGISWTLPYSGTYQGLRDVDFFNTDVAVAIGFHGTAVRSVDGGETWSPISNLVDSSYQSLSLTASGVGYIITGYGHVLRSTDFGETWKQVVTVAFVPYYGLEFLDPATGMITADSGRIFRTVDSGATWSVAFADTSTDLFMMDFVDSLRGVAGGDDRTFVYTADGGKSWQRGVGPDSGIIPTTVTMVDTSTIVAAGFHDQGVLSSLRHFIARSTDGGKTWLRQESDIIVSGSMRYEQVLSVSGTVYAVGLMGVVLRSEDHGVKWEAVSNTELLSPFGGQAVLNGVAFADDTVGVIPNDFLGIGAMLRTTDAGVTWTYRLTRQLGIIEPRFFSPTYAIAGSDRSGWIYRTTDAGKTWLWHDITDEPPRYVTTWAFTMLDENHGMKVGDASIYRTTNGGETWKGEPVGDVTIVTDMSAVSPSVVFCTTMAGSGDNNTIYRVHKSLDSGKTWAIILERKGWYFYEISFVDDSIGFVSTRETPTEGEKMYRTTNSGRTWDSVATERGVVTDVRFFSRANGVAVGANASVLTTKDGGRTWEPDGIDPFVPEFTDRAFTRSVLLPDRRTVMAVGYGCIARKVFPQPLSGVDDPFGDAGGSPTPLSVYPNPVSEEAITIRLDPSTIGREFSLSVVDVLGRTVTDVTSDVRIDHEGGRLATVNRAGWPPGVYLVVLRAGGHVWSCTILLQ